MPVLPAPRRVILSLALALFVAAPVARGQSLYAWGANSNGQLGDGTTTDRYSPTVIAGFGYGVDAVAGGTFHSLAVRNGTLYAWGYNGSGELGDGTTTTRLAPVAVSALSSGVTAVSAGVYTSLAIRNGVAYAWGYNVDGQTGNGTFSASTGTPTAVIGLGSGVTAVSAGGYHNLAIQNGAAVAWGYNGNGQLGDGTTTTRSLATVVLASGVTAISGGGYHSLAVRDGAALAWGYNFYGQLGDNSSADRSSPTAVGGGLTAGVTAVSAGQNHSLAIKDGVAYAWGQNNLGQLGDGTTAQRNTPVPVSGLPAVGILQIGAGDNYGLALTTDHRLYAWGSNANGQFGNGTATGSPTPVQVTAPAGFYFAAIEGGAGHTVATLMPNAAGVYAAGNNSSGQLGDGSTTSRTSPVAATGMNAGINAYSASKGHLNSFSLAIRNGGAYAWGDNSFSQLGDGTATQRSSPVAITGLASGVSAVSAGGHHGLAIRNGAVFAWGQNGQGQLGDGSTTSRTSPVAVSTLASGVSAISAGHFHSLALRNGAVFAWGYNVTGEVGDGTTTQRNAPVAVSVLTSGVSAISAGSYNTGAHNLAIRNGAVYAWGYNASGQVGDGSTTNRLTPVATSVLTSGVSAISAGTFHSLAIKDGTAYAWGQNNLGQLGDGTTTTRLTPIPVPGLPAAGILQVSAGGSVDGGSFSLALTTDHRLFAWGDNSNGQFGNGTTTSSLTPVEVFAPAGFMFASIDAGSFHTAYFLAPVPEPGTILGVGALALGAAAAWRKRRRAVTVPT